MAKLQNVATVGTELKTVIKDGNCFFPVISESRVIFPYLEVWLQKQIMIISLINMIATLHLWFTCTCNSYYSQVAVFIHHLVYSVFHLIQ